MNDELQQIQFEEESHTYTRNGANYISVTTLLEKYGLSAQYSANIPDAVMKQAAERGTRVHKCLEDYIKNNIIDPTCDEVVTFNQYITNRGIDLTTASSEEIVYDDTYLIAGTLDFQYTDGHDTIIADFKTTSSIHWEAVSWQLSIYNFIKSKGDILQYYMNKLMVYHLRGPKLNVREVPLIDYNEVVNLLTANLYNDPYSYHPDYSKIISDSEGVVLEQLVSEILQCKTLLAELEAKKAGMYKKIITNMESTSTPTFSTPNLKITYVPMSARETIDKKALMKYCEDNNIDVKQFLSFTKVKETIRVTPITICDRVLEECNG